MCVVLCFNRHFPRQPNYIHTYISDEQEYWHTNSNLNTSKSENQLACVRHRWVYLCWQHNTTCTRIYDDSQQQMQNEIRKKHADAVGIFGKLHAHACGFPTPITLNSEIHFRLVPLRLSLSSSPPPTSLYCAQNTQTRTHRAHVMHGVYTRLDIYSNSNPHTSSLCGRLRLAADVRGAHHFSLSAQK